MKKSLIILALAMLFGVAAHAQTPADSTATPPLVNDSIQAIYRQALDGDANAQTEVGLWYYNGVNVLQDYNQAVQWWLRAANQGNAAATGNLGICYANGNGVEVDSVRSTKLILRSLKQGNEGLRQYLTTQADSGNVFCSAIIAESMSRTRGGVTVYPDQAIPYLTTCAQAGSVENIDRLALCYYNKRNFSEAYRWFNIAAGRGDLNANYFAASMLLDGRGVAANPGRAADMLLVAARRGHANAMYLLGQCYLNGKGLTASPENALMWYRRAAGAGSPRASWEVARANVDGTLCPVDYDNAMLYFALAARQSSNRKFLKYVSDSIAGTDFAVYLRGRQLMMNDSLHEAFNEFKRLARNQSAEGKLWQGLAYLDTAYNKHSDTKAFKEVKAAAEAGFAPAQLQYARMLETATGTERDLVKAVENYTAAAEAGYGPAMCALAGLYYEGRGVEQDFEQAVRWYNKAYEIGMLSALAAHRLADCYANGLGGLEADPAKAQALQAVTDLSPAALIRAI